MKEKMIYLADFILAQNRGVTSHDLYMFRQKARSCFSKNTLKIELIFLKMAHLSFYHPFNTIMGS